MNWILGIIIFYGVVLGCKAEDVPCVVETGSNAEGVGKVCVCNSSYCDTINRPSRLPQGQYHMYSTSNSTPGFSHTVASFTTDPPVYDDDVVFTVNATVQFQEILGFGGSFSDSAGIVLNSLPEAARDNLIRSYFGTTGIEYSFGRVPIGASDFSTRDYTLDDTPGGIEDLDFKYFNLTYEDYSYKIPYIKQAMAINERPLKLLGCSWLAPTWMKASHNFRGYVQPKYMDAFAEYYVKFLQAYKQEGIDMWSLSGGNEVLLLLLLTLPLNSTIMIGPAQRQFFQDYLKPRLIAANFTDVKLVALEDQRYFADYFMERFAIYPEALSTVDAIGLHWYFDYISPYSILDDLHEKYPDKLILYTEASINRAFSSVVVDFGSWYRGESYMYDIIQNLNHYAQNFIDWNLCLNMEGGPAFGFPTDASIVVNTTSGVFYKQPMFYAMGHFSKFLPPGSKRVLVESNQNQTDDTTSNRATINSLLGRTRQHSTKKGLGSPNFPLPITITVPSTIISVGTANPDGSYTVIVFSSLNETSHVRIVDERVGTISVDIEPKSINSFIYWLD